MFGRSPLMLIVCQKITTFVYWQPAESSLSIGVWKLLHRPPMLIPWPWRSSMLFGALILYLHLAWNNKKLPCLCLLGPHSSEKRIIQCFLLGADLTQSSTGRVTIGMVYVRSPGHYLRLDKLGSSPLPTLTRVAVYRCRKIPSACASIKFPPFFESPWIG